MTTILLVKCVRVYIYGNDGLISYDVVFVHMVSIDNGIKSNMYYRMLA